GAPLNVAVGIAKLGGAVEFAGSVGEDVLGDRLAGFLANAGVGTRNLIRVPAPTTLAVATFDGAEPDFRFYGEPPSYGAFGPADLDQAAVAGAGALYCGSIGLLCPRLLAAARRAWATPGPVRVFDPNVRPRLLPDRDALLGLRALVEEFAARADLVKLSAADAQLLYDGATAREAAALLRRAGAGTVVTTRGAQGAFVATADGEESVAAPSVRAIDATGAGDSVMAALTAQLLAAGPPDGVAGWRGYVEFALQVAGLVCESRGGAVAMPTREQVHARFAPS
ncbi:MAG TPA: PfkB family carbohydrate kinase, partial [Micromonosporaceae bacterium]|nr:PfkB family carbohydrate kinase [Micromonosporaceae bacterium]